MNYLLSLRRLLREHTLFGAFFGGTIFLLSAVAAILLHFSYFYSTFVIGVFLFFDSLAHLLNRSLAFSSNLERIGRTFWALIVGFIVATDFVGGQIIFSVWRYPPYASFANWVLLYIIIYPVGGLSVIAMFRFFDTVFASLIPGRLFNFQNAELWTKRILKLIFVFSPLVLIIPLVLYFAGLVPVVSGNWFVYSLLFLFIFFEWTFFFDCLVMAFGGRPILLDILRGEKKTIMALLVSGLLSAFLHEIVNTYVHEWVYLADKFPVTAATFLGVPIMVFITWVPLTIVCIEAYRLAMVIREKQLLLSLRKAYLGVS